MVGNETVECMQHSRMMCICMWWTFVYASLCQRTENRAHKKHAFASVCSVRHEGVGGSMLTFLVLLPLHVATLHRCLAVLHLCMHCRNGPQCWKVDTWVASACVRRSWGVLTFLIVPCTSSATCCYAAQMSGSAASLYTLLKRPRSACVDTWLEKSVATLEQSMPHGMLSKTSSPTRCVQRSQIFSSYVKCWQWRYVSLHAHLQQKRNPRWSACSEKKERKNLPTCSNDMNPKPTRNAHFARDNLVHFGLQKCLFRFGENVIF